MDKILISSCFLGQLVRYDGQTKRLNDSAILKWHKQGRLISLCPEVAGGLPVPRAPAEINSTSNKVLTQQGEDVSSQFITGANKALSMCQQHHIKYALLKESSPSCGVHWVYDGHFSGHKIAGMGVTAQLLYAQGIQVFSEQNINELIKIIEGRGD